MLTLLLLRHAKSSWDAPIADDFERPLADRGRNAAPLMGRFIEENNLKPELVLCSSAVRTQATLDLVMAELGKPPPAVRYEDQLYLAPASSLLADIRRTAARWKRVMLVGHNPGMHDLARHLIGMGEPPLLAALGGKFPTAALAVLTFDATHWADVGEHGGRLTHFVTPAGLGKGSPSA